MLQPCIWNKEFLLKALPQIAHCPEFTSHGVCIDSRQVSASDLFIGLKGQAFDGGKFAETAIANGAALCLVNSDVAAPHDSRIIKIQDTVAALTNMARFRRQQFHNAIKIIGVTGSAGKTSTKELVSLALRGSGKTYATSGNFNNHLGLPLTIVNTPLDTQYCVLEMGMNHAGEISYLADIAKPHIGIVTTVAPAHLEYFNSVHDIALAKAEIYDHMTVNDYAIINIDHPHQNILLEKAESKGLQILTYGENKQADFRLSSYRTDTKTKVTAWCHDQDISYYFPVIIGKHLVINSLAALAVAYALGCDLNKCANNMANFTPVCGRGAAQALRDNIILIDDAYNANPASIKAAFNTLSSYQINAKRTIAVLGDIRELGEEGPALHAALALDAIYAKIDKVYTVGQLMSYLFAVLPESMKGAHAADATSMSNIIVSAIKPGDVVIVKGSNSMNMSEIVQAIKMI